MTSDYIIVEEPTRDSWAVFDRIRDLEESVSLQDLEVYHYPRGTTADVETRVLYAYLTRLMEEGRYTKEAAARTRLEHEIDNLL